MSVEQSNKIDAIGIDKKLNAVVLSISDHLDWANPEEHLLLLQEKLNSYLSFCESGEIYESYPLAIGKKIVFEVYGKLPLPQEGVYFFDQARKIIKEARIELRFTLLV